MMLHCYNNDIFIDQHVDTIKVKQITILHRCARNISMLTCQHVVHCMSGTCQKRTARVAGGQKDAVNSFSSQCGRYGYCTCRSMPSVGSPLCLQCPVCSTIPTKISTAAVQCLNRQGTRMPSDGAWLSTALYRCYR